MAEPGAVLEAPVRKVVEEKGRPEARAGPIFGNLAVVVPEGEPALAVELELATVGARDWVRAVVQDRGPAQVVELVRGLDRVVEAVPAWDQGVRQVPEETKAPESSLPPWAGGDPPRHY